MWVPRFVPKDWHKKYKDSYVVTKDWRMEGKDWPNPIELGSQD